MSRKRSRAEAVGEEESEISFSCEEEEEESFNCENAEDSSSSSSENETPTTRSDHAETATVPTKDANLVIHRCPLCRSSSENRCSKKYTIPSLLEHQEADCPNKNKAVFRCNHCHVLFVKYMGLRRHKMWLHDEAAGIESREERSAKKLLCKISANSVKVNMVRRAPSRRSASNHVRRSRSSEAPVKVPRRSSSKQSPIKSPAPLDLSFISHPPPEKVNNQVLDTIKEIPHSVFSEKIQHELESFVDDKYGAIDKSRFEVRQVSSVRQSHEVGSLVKQVFELPSSRIDSTSRTLFLFETFSDPQGDKTAIVFSLFSEECPSNKAVFVTNFGFPAIGVDDDLHRQIFATFLLSYLSCIVECGFERVYLSTRSIKVDRRSDQNENDLIFHGANCHFPATLLSSTLDQGASRLGLISKFETLLKRFQTEPFHSVPVLIDGPDWLDRFNSAVAHLLMKSPNQMIREGNWNNEQSPDQIRACDMIARQLVSKYRFVVIDLIPSQKRNAAPPSAVCLPTPVYLSSSEKFREKCRLNEWRFDSSEAAYRSTALIVRHLALLATEANVSQF